MRLQGLDIFRGYAIVLMVAFHLSFDLNNFHYLSLDLKHGDFWKYFRYVIVSMFVFTAGISLYLSNKEKISWNKVVKRVFILTVASTLVSIGSYSQFPNTWIYFGILHFFLFSSIAGLLFIRHKYFALLSGVVILLGFNFSFLNMHWLFNLLYIPLHLPVAYTEDLANIIPWFGVFLLGISFASFDLEIKLFDREVFQRKTVINRFFSYLGKHSLVIYLIHQPILFAIFFIFNSLFFSV